MRSPIHAAERRFPRVKRDSRGVREIQKTNVSPNAAVGSQKSR